MDFFLLFPLFYDIVLLLLLYVNVGPTSRNTQIIIQKYNIIDEMKKYWFFKKNTIFFIHQKGFGFLSMAFDEFVHERTSLLQCVGKRNNIIIKKKQCFNARPLCDITVHKHKGQVVGVHETFRCAETMCKSIACGPHHYASNTKRK